MKKNSTAKSRRRPGGASGTHHAGYDRGSNLRHVITYVEALNPTWFGAWLPRTENSTDRCRGCRPWSTSPWVFARTRRAQADFNGSLEGP